VDIARQRIWSQSEIEALWGVPVLIDVPEILTDSDIAATRKKKYTFAASSVAAAMAYSVVLYMTYLKAPTILQKLDPLIQKVVYK
jgi:hypothetical protein